MPNRVYPRVYGGTDPSNNVPATVKGLSPRVRGNPAEADGFGAGRGSIPACTGEPRGHGYRSRSRRVYPRVYGGTRARRDDEHLAAGLSPRVRGNLPLRVRAGGRAGSIPACTGEPREGRRMTWRPKVYPRVYGGTPCKRRGSAAWGGLSPRVRGNHEAQAAVQSYMRSIPACTGEPPHIGPLAPCSKVYPRVYGGTQRGPKDAASGGGLSPRVRGNPLQVPGYREQERSIPACTGEPVKPKYGFDLSVVYPRVYGGTGRLLDRSTSRSGLSPRVRGNRAML